MTKIEIIIIMLSSDIVSAHKRTLPLKDKVNKFAHKDLMHAKYENVFFHTHLKLCFTLMAFVMQKHEFALFSILCFNLL